MPAAGSLDLRAIGAGSVYQEKMQPEPRAEDTPVPIDEPPPEEQPGSGADAVGVPEPVDAVISERSVPPRVLPPADGGLLVIGVGESCGRIVSTLRPTGSVSLLRLLERGSGEGSFVFTSPSPEDMLDCCPFLEDLGLNAETLNPDLRSCAKAVYLIHRAALLDRIRRLMDASPISTFAIVADAASALGATILSELPLDLEGLFERRQGKHPILLRIPLFPVSGGEELEKTTLYALARELDSHLLGSGDEEGDDTPVCENPNDLLVLADFQVGTPAQRRDELERFLGSLAGFFRGPGGLKAKENPILEEENRITGPWRRGFRDLISLWSGNSWTGFRRRKLLKEIEMEGTAPPLVDQEPWRAGRRLYLELDLRFRRLLNAGNYDYPGRLSPDDAGSHLELGEQLLEDGRDRDAFDAFQAAIEARADLPECYEGLGRAAMLLGEFDAAQTAFTRAIQLDPASRMGHEGVILCHLHSGSREQAKRHQELAAAVGCEIDPELMKRLGA